MWSLGALLDGLLEGGAPGEHASLSISGIHDDSRRVQPGGLFVALRGSAQDGRAFVRDALARGAAVIIGEELEPQSGAVVIGVRDARALLARLAWRWHGVEEAQRRGLRLVGVTGTNGKTTTSHMTAAILRAAGLRCGLIGTVQVDLCTRAVTAGMTTPGPLELAQHLRSCADAGGTVVVAEVSSHALDQRRTEGLRFAAAGFTNLTQDHLDYHGTMEAYGQAKARLFAGLDSAATAVVNADDPAAERMVRDGAATVVRYGLGEGAALRGYVMRDTIRGTLFRVRTPSGDVVLENALVGRHNVSNALCAAGLTLALGAEPRSIETGLASVRNIPGRLQRVQNDCGFEIFVDYAHTEDALRNVLGVLRPLTPRRLIVVFGCGGDRDRGKRPRMGAAAAELADELVVTSDNPRTEDPRRIIDDILAGIGPDAAGRMLVEPDRRAAIEQAIARAEPGDVVLIAGKGHETYQIVGSERRHFDDVEAALEAVALRSRPSERRGR